MSCVLPLIPDSTVVAGRRGVIHHAIEDGNGGWFDIGPLAVNNNTAIGVWRELESVQLILQGGRWHLFFTYFGIGGIYWTSNDQVSSGWDISSAVLIDPGVGAEVTPTANGKWILTRHGSAVHSPQHPDAGLGTERSGRIPGLRRDRLAQVEAADLGADRRGHGADREVAHLVTSSP